MTERLHKRIASSGYCSRRMAERLIAEGEVEVNGSVVKEMGVQVTEKDRITVEGTKLKFTDEKVTIMMNKPTGIVTTRNDPMGEETVMDLLPRQFQHLNPVGRLDRESEGLLLLTTDGELLLHLTHPRYEHEKTYEVGLYGTVEPTTLEALEDGVELDGKRLAPMYGTVLREEGHRTWVQVILREGRKRQIRRVMEQFGHTVFALRRVAIGELKLGDLKTGAYTVVTEKEIKMALSK